LIGHYQAGRDPTPDLALRPGPLPKFDGGPAGGPTSPTIQPPPGPPPNALQPQASGSGPIRVPPLTADKSTQYAQLFEKSGAQNGVLPGEQAKQIFERAGLPNEILGRIWNLADTELRGALTATEFVIAMHLLASFKSGALRALPNILPAGLYEAAARRTPSRQSSGTPSNISAIPRQFSGAGPVRASSPLSRPAYIPPPQQVAQGTRAGNDWAISPLDKSRFDDIYNGLDRANRGYITGDEAVPFFSESKLPEEVLAQIWDLADINSAGHLTRDEFAVAMYLIRQQRGKKDGRDSLPLTLPLNLVPPSMRNQIRSNVPTAPVFDAAPSIPKSAADDLFGLDALSSPPPPAQAQAAQSTGGSTSFGGNRQLGLDPFGPSGTPMTPASPTRASPPQSSLFKPFAPSSSFGQALTQNVTGGSNSSGPQQRGFQPQPSATEDLLGDADPEVSKRLTNETTELANLSNQVGTLSKQMTEVQGQRANTQNELTQASSQKRQFEERLAQLRTLYEQEVKDVKSLEERLNASRNETKKIQTDIAMIEGTYQDLQNQHRQIVTALQADQQENANLKERMRVVNAEVTQLRPQLEKLRSDARQQKGMVAINKKQLATNEGERDKLKQEAEDLNKSIEEDTKILAAAAAAKVQSPPQVASPAPSTMSANNPFFRRHGSTSEITPPYATSPIANKQDNSFENLFGPAFGAAAVAEAAPTTTFRQESTSNPSTSTLPLRSQTTGEFPKQGSSPVTSNANLPPANEPAPSPPESRQINSSFLPFPDHEDSVTSSRQVSAPNSRFGEGSTGADTPTNYNGTTPTSSSNAGQAEVARTVSPGLDRRSQASPPPAERGESMPGAFPGDTNAHIVATPTGSSALSEQGASDPFAITKEPVRSATVKDDFDAAFAGFGSSAKTQERSHTGNSTDSATGAPSGFNKEFPPIAELEHDDDSDSASETGGFDDDFAPASPGHTRKASWGQNAVTSPPAASTSNAMSDFFAPRPGTANTASSRGFGAEPPPANAQVSPPTYENVVPAAEQAHLENQQFSGLLPSREVPSPEQVGATHSTEGQTPFGAPQVSSQPAPPAKIPFDDDFDDFDNLEDAKEGSADDDFANISVHDRDFNPMFDSPPAPKSSEPSFGTDSAFGNLTSSPQKTSQASNSITNDNNDWDAIFAGLDNPAPSATNGPTQAAPAETNGTKLSPERPIVGRALTDTGAHDDPILKNLTSMGYSRTDSLAALEKYDYDLERVRIANQLK